MSVKKMKVNDILNKDTEIKVEITKLKEYLLQLDSMDKTDERVIEYTALIKEKIETLLSDAESNKDLFLEKVEQLLFLIGEKESELSFYKSKKKDIENKIKSVENSISWIKSIIENGLNRYKLLDNFQRVKTSCFSMSYNKTPKLIIDTNLLNKQYFKETTVLSPDKDKINKLLDEGHFIEGVKREHSFTIRGVKTNNEKDE